MIYRGWILAAVSAESFTTANYMWFDDLYVSNSRILLKLATFYTVHLISFGD
jgi:hypothetical protein